MKELKAMSTFSPAVLVVDDDPAYIKVLRRKFHEQTSVGVLVAKDIRQGHALLASKTVRIDALLTDIYFDEGKDWPEEEMFDGIDLAAAVKQMKPNLPTYFLSFFADDPSWKEKANRKGIEPAGWLQKLFSRDAHKKDATDTPWRTVEMALFRDRLKLIDGTEEGTEGQLDQKAAVSLAARLRYPIRTYIQTLPNDDPSRRLKVTEPIEVICTLDEDLAKATAPMLGLLQEGYGESIEGALESLAGIIQVHYEMLTRTEIRTVDYAEVVRDRLSQFVCEDR